MTEAKTEYLNEVDEELLRRLIDDPKTVGQMDQYGNRAFPLGSDESASLCRLREAGMVTVSRHPNDLVFNSVKAAGYSYIKKVDKEREDEQRRVQEREEDKRRDWALNLVNGVYLILGVVLGVVAGVVVTMLATG